MAHSRYIVTVHPLKAHYAGRRHTVLVIAAIWLLSVALQSPDLLLYERIIQRVLPPRVLRGTATSTSVCSQYQCSDVIPEPRWVPIYEFLLELQVILNATSYHTVVLSL